ncbi:unnamed protein product [Polarella glacialis]|uniref:Uncharacterized protein n=1 Tax=Polarella glacialis TaxID=89957 RepID=A0A813G6U1_POLGL|nr:unnamed protein product [Polarella glacialis]
MAASRCPRSELSIVVFGDSWSDAGSQGFGAVNLEVSTSGGYPAAAQLEPTQAIRAIFGSVYPFSHFGYVEGAFTDGPVWASQLGVKAVFNFVHGSASTCQEIPGLVVPPPGYVAMPTSTGWTKLAETTLRPRGVAQQLVQAAELLPLLGVLGCPGRTLAVVFVGGNDSSFTASSPLATLLRRLSSALLFRITSRYLQTWLASVCHKKTLFSAACPPSSLGQSWLRNQTLTYPGFLLRWTQSTRL